MFLKLGEAIDILGIENTDSCVSIIDPAILDDFRKTAANLKRIAPKADDFLYFSAVMMHAAEAASLNDDGTLKLNAKGESVQVGWDKRGGTWRWISNDPNIKPYKNSNGDIFPEEELVRAHSKWKHKPLCIDHKSSSVDHTRGFIVDTYYDRGLKRVIALCALDKANYPDLARKVSTGMQTCVSMGTAVGRAICSDCATVARAESDFCDHMRRKTCYGEINIDLNPIELSIVVNGADPKANIKHIIAAANTLNSYVETKSKELQKLAELNYHASFSVSDPTVGNGHTSTFDINGTNMSDFKNDVEQAFDRLAEITDQAKNLEKDTNHLAFNQSSGSLAMNEGAVGNTNLEISPPVARYASTIGELKEVMSSVENKLNQMKKSLDKLSYTHEENMPIDLNKKGYYQGTEEPTPGQPKYPKDPLNEQLREHEDRQMVGQSPFPDVGPVDGMHPSPASADPSNELERKKMLARAEAEERAMRRAAIVNLAKQAIEDKKAQVDKFGYWNNGEGPNNPNTPTPNKVKYPSDKLQEDVREHEDKHMVGQKPFPGVGPVDGMHPSPSSADTTDELKRKEILRRANTLHGRFVRASNSDGTRDLQNSAWEIRLGDRLLLSASVKDLSGGRSEMMYDSINTAEFGQRLLEKVKVLGADKVRSMVKSAQDGTSAPGAAPVTPPVDAAPPGAPVEDTGKTGDKKESAIALAEKVRDMGSDLVEAVRALTGEQAEMGADVGAPVGDMGAAASDFSVNQLNSWRSEINGQLTDAMTETIDKLNDHQQELEMIAAMYAKGHVTVANENLVDQVLDEAEAEAKTAVAEGFRLITAFIKYARGTKAVVKRAEIEAELHALAEGDTMSGESGDSDLMSLIHDTGSELDAVQDMMADDNDHMGEDLGVGDEVTDEGLDLGEDGADNDGMGDLDLGLGGDEEEVAPVDDNDLMAKPEELKDLNVKPGTNVQVTAGFSNRAARAALRAKLAADATGKYDDGQLQDMSKARFSDMLDDADRLADGQTKLDIKPSDDLGYIETLPEINKAMLEVAKAPPKVRKEAATIQKMVAEGTLDPKDIDALVSHGLDKEAVSYWKKYYGQTDGGGEFASELVKEHVKAQLETELGNFKVKIARAYELTYDMVDRSLVANDRNVISAHVDELMSFNEGNFETLKKVVAKHPVTLRKEASSRVPQVGLIGSDDVNSSSPAEDDWSLLSAAFAKTSKRMF